MAAMDSLNHDTYTVNSESDKISLNVSLLPLTSSASNINVQSVEVSTQSLTDKTLYTALPEMTTSDNSNNYVLINLQELQDKVWNEMGTPFLVLTNNEKGNVEAKVLYNTSSVGLIKLPASGANIHTVAQSSVMVQPTNKAVKQPPKTLIRVSSEQTNSVSKTEAPTQTCLESKQLLSTFASCVNTTPTTAVNTVSVALGTEQIPTGCSKTFPTVGYKKYNQQTSQGTQRSLECSFEGCGRKFSWPAHLKYHQMTHTGERQYACTSDGCLKTFYTSQRLAVHIRTHTGEKPFKCQEEGCEKAFTTAGNLKNHIRVHTGERPFVCNYMDCSRSFAEYSSLRKHKLVHTGEKPFICDECGKSFSQSGSRTVHIKRHHGIGAKKGKEGGGGGVGTQQQQQHPPNQNDCALDKKGTNIFILRNGVEEDEGIMQYQDFPGGESVVFSQDMSDHVVTVTTQPCAAEERVISDQIVTVTSHSSAPEEAQDRENIDMSQEILSSEMLPGDSLNRVSLSSNSANVMVLSQPQEMVSLGSSNNSSTYHTTHASNQGTDDIVYENDLLENDLEHKEMSATMGHHILTISASLSPQQELAEETASLLHSTKEVTLDPMMASDEEEDEDALSIGIQQHTKVD